MCLTNVVQPLKQALLLQDPLGARQARKLAQGCHARRVCAQARQQAQPVGGGAAAPRLLLRRLPPLHQFGVGGGGGRHPARLKGKQALQPAKRLLAAQCSVPLPFLLLLPRLLLSCPRCSH